MTFSTNFSTNSDMHKTSKAIEGKKQIKFDSSEAARAWGILNESKFPLGKIDISIYKKAFDTIEIIYSKDQSVLKVFCYYGNEMIEINCVENGTISPQALANFILGSNEEMGLGLTLEELENAIKNTIELRKSK